MLKKILSFGTLFLILSAMSFAGERNLNCKVMPENDDSITWAEGSISLDVKPKVTDPYPSNGMGYTEEVIRKYLTINGKKGKLFVRFTAAYYNNYKGDPSFTNINERFPRVDVMAFFYEELPEGGYAGPYTEVAVRAQGSPTIDMQNVYPRSQFGMWTVGLGAKILCLVNEA